MQYHDFEMMLEEPAGLAKMLRGGGIKNNMMQIFQDYYDGNQWLFDRSTPGPQAQTRTTRSGKVMWKQFDDNSSKGMTLGELKVWNIIKAANQIYSKYVRGDESDDVEISVKRGGNIDDVLSKSASDLFVDLNTFVMETTAKMGIDSVAITKLFMFNNKDNDGELEGNEADIVKKIRLNTSQDFKGIIESIDPMTVCPIYWKDMIRGYIRYYIISKEEALADYGIEFKKDPLYWEVWFIDDNAVVQLNKYLDDQLLTDLSGEAPYDFLPFTLVSNEKHPKHHFCMDSCEISDVEDLIDLQDDINAFLTDLGIIYRRVAIPMLKATDEFVKEARTGDLEKLKREFSKLSTMAGQILFAPVERIDGGDVGAGTIAYLGDLKEQFYMLTGIPKSVFNSEGLSNIAANTLDYILQSLIKRVGDKRTKVAQLIRQNVEMYLKATKQWEDTMEIEVIFPDIYGITKTERMNLLTQGNAMGVLPKPYLVKETVEILGDVEDTKEITGQALEEDLQAKQQVEALMSQTRQMTTSQNANAALQEMGVNQTVGANQNNMMPANP